MNKNIILIGFMGSGKSLTSLCLAEHLGKRCVSTDVLVEQREGKKIADIFQDSGEDYFRQLEHEVIQEISKKTDVVVDCGGGVVLNPVNMVLLKKSGIVIYLLTSPEMVHERTKREEQRPLLNVENPLERINELLEKRKPFYEQANYVVDTDHKTVEIVAKEIMELLNL